MKVKNVKFEGLHINRTGEFCCTVCGNAAGITRFKNGFICSSCLQYVKANR